MNKNIWIGIIVVVALIAIGVAYFVGKNTNNLSQSANTPQAPLAIQTSPTATQTPPPVVSKTTPTPQNNSESPSSNIDESRACAQQAAIVAKNFEASSAAMGVPVSPGDGSFQYQSHYNASQEKCFYASTDIGTYNGNSVLTHSLLNAYDNSTIGSYFLETSPANVTVTETCDINGVMGCTNKEFRAFLNTEMESTMY